MKRVLFAALLVSVVSFGMQAWAVEPAGALTKDQVKALIQSAKTEQDHLQLASYYRQEQTALQNEAREHEQMAADYGKNPASHPIPKAPLLGSHCRDLAKRLNTAAAAAGKLASDHEAMAKDAR